MPPVLSIIGKSGSGKTTLIEKLIPELKKRGYRIGTIKHAHHGFAIDMHGKDSARHKAAGADAVMVASPEGFVMVKNSSEPPLDELTAHLRDLDLIITEGYKHQEKPKIEVCRRATQKTPLAPELQNIIAFVSDMSFDLPIPMFGLEHIAGIADLIEEELILKS